MSKIEKHDYLEEAERGYNLRTAREEASRCLICHDAPCSGSCPAGTDPARFIRSLVFNNVKGAAETIRRNNPLGGVCARVCPYDRLCQEGCSRSGIDKPIEIGKIQRFLVEQEQAFQMNVVDAAEKKRKWKVACIGAGPASLTVAARLAESGISVTVFEANEKPGGVLTYGIIPSRLPQAVVNYDISQIERLGVTFELNTRVETIESIFEKGYDVVFVGIGLWNSKKSKIPGADLPGVWNALDYLRTARETDGKFDQGRSVVIIGGGDVAMDCAATAKLTGAENVAIYYRRTLEEAPANIDELKYVQSLGIPITTDFAPVEILEIGGRAGKVVFQGRDGVSEAKIAVDTVVFAIGQAVQTMENFDEFIVDKKGLVIVDERGAVGVEGVFAAGDVVNGGKTVVEAVKEGKNVAAEIIRYLNTKEGEE